ncbi:hypothetical protein CCR75_002659 [Bremia lactucae]|uniref:Nuclear nucleic acid-binding protein C1D n=1 Tax=Bremia lactucae TaxID=4779 RepID=A0A976IJ45_BRELC|nr:hypothetical protein CCR75_002659 [Bremia lactucae]
MNNEAGIDFDSVDQTLAAVHKHLALFNQTTIEDFEASLSSLERAKVHVSLAYTINALLFVFLKTQGISTQDVRHSHVKKELERVKSFIRKIKDAEDQAKPKLALDKNASKRFIHNALSSDQVYVDAVKGKEASLAVKKQTVKPGGKSKRTATNSFGKNKRQRKK